jgi:hypothetical protein
MITFYRTGIYEYASNPRETLAVEFRRRFLSSRTNMRTLLCRPVFEKIGRCVPRSGEQDRMVLTTQIARHNNDREA